MHNQLIFFVFMLPNHPLDREKSRFLWNIPASHNHDNYHEVRLDRVPEAGKNEFYFAFFCRFDRIDSRDIWHEGNEAESFDKAFEIKGDGIRWTINTGERGMGNRDHHFSVFVSNPDYQLNPQTEIWDSYYQNHDGYSRRNAIQLEYEKWHAFVFKFRWALDHSGEIALWVDGHHIMEYTGIKTVKEPGTFDRLQFMGTFAQPAYDAPPHIRKMDAVLLTDEWPRVVNGGYLQEPSVPLVTAAAGDFCDGCPVTVAGRGFGDTGPHIVLFDDFETGAEGRPVSVAPGSAAVGHWTAGAGNNLTTYSREWAHSGFQCMKSDFDRPDSEPGNQMRVEFPGTGELFCTFYTMIPEGKNVPGDQTAGGNPIGPNWKLCWIFGGGPWPDNDYVPVVVLSETLNSDGIGGLGFNDLRTWNGRARFPDDIYSGENWWWGTDDWFKSRWKRFSVYLRGGQTDGVATLTELTAKGPAERIHGAGTFTLMDGHSWSCMTMPGYGRGQTRDAVTAYDDVYLATGPGARARIEIGEAPTYAASGHLSVMTALSWSDTLVQATVRRGVFTVGPAFLYVVNANGVVNHDGFPVMLTGAPPSGHEPVIHAVTGTAAHGDTLTIHGVRLNDEAKIDWDSFFTKNPFAYSFEGGQDGQNIAADGYGEIGYGVSASGVYDSEVSILGGHSARFHIHGASSVNLEDYSVIDLDGGPANDIWIRMYVRWRLTGAWPDSHIKMIMCANGFPDSYYFQPACSVDGLLPRDMTAVYDSESHPVPVPSGRLENDRWYAVEMHWKSDFEPYVFDAWMDGVQIVDATPVTQGPLDWLLFGLVNGCCTSSGFALDHWVDGFAVARSRIYPSATVLVGDHADPGSGRCVAQPLLSISDEAIRFKLDLTGLGTGPWYLRVVNNRQEHSAVFPLAGPTHAPERDRTGTDLAGEAGFQVLQNYPNPFNAVTVIRFRVQEKCRVLLQVYDILGHEVAVPLDDIRAPGHYSVHFDGSRLAAGIYFYRIRMRDFSAVEKMVLLE